MHCDNSLQQKLCRKSREREKLQFHFDQCFVNGDKITLREQYKRLRQLEMELPEEFDIKPVNISSLVESITVACDVVLSQMGFSIIYCGNSTSFAMCNQKLITKVILNLISNAYLYGTEKLVIVKTIETADFIKIEIQSGGYFKNNIRKKGLSFVWDVCYKSQGRFFIEQSFSKTKAIIILKKVHVCADTETIDFNSFIEDRLSPVYVELFGMEYN